MEDGIPEEIQRWKDLSRQVRFHLLVCRVPLQPCQRCDHAEQKKQFGVFFNTGLHKEGTFFRIQAGTEPIHDHIKPVGLYLFRIPVVARQSVPIRNKIIAVIISAILKVDPSFSMHHTGCPSEVFPWGACRSKFVSLSTLVHSFINPIDRYESNALKCTKASETKKARRP